MPETVERPSQASQDHENVFDKIEAIAHILEGKKELTAEETEQVTKMLNEVSDETKRLDGKVRSFFQDEVLARIRILLPEHPFFKELDANSGEFVDSVDLLIGGQAAFARIMDGIRSAQQSIFINIFIWRDDQIGNRIAAEVLAAADRGVKVTIEKDRLGAIFEHAEQGKQSFFHKELLPEEIQKARFVDAAYNRAGEAVDAEQKINPLVQKLLEHPNITIRHNAVRNDHSKYYIFDNTRLITGGMNIGDEYQKEWHDYMVEANSPLLVRKFRERLSGQDDFDKGSSIEFSLNLPSTLVEKKEIKPMVQQLLSNAHKEIIIEMAYFGDSDITNAIIEAANRGVDVTIIVPRQANIQDALNRRIIREILQKTDNRAKVYLFPRMLHAKLIHVDEQLTFVGSANLNEEATERLAETNVLINDANAPLTQEVRKQLLDDMAMSTHARSSNEIEWGILDGVTAYGEQYAGKFTSNSLRSIGKPESSASRADSLQARAKPMEQEKQDSSDLLAGKQAINLAETKYEVAVNPPATIVVNGRRWRLEGMSGNAKGATLNILKAVWDRGNLELVIKGTKRIGIGYFSKDFSQEKQASLNGTQAKKLLEHLATSNEPFLIPDKDKKPTGVHIVPMSLVSG
ncbi:MAG: phosphatidylserine/phosphatidylglycerophosphate/cardiolipin synthase family protein [Candidatus Peribacteraceae bacterium]